MNTYTLIYNWTSKEGLKSGFGYITKTPIKKSLFGSFDFNDVNKDLNKTLKERGYIEEDASVIIINMIKD